MTKKIPKTRTTKRVLHNKKAHRIREAEEHRIVVIEETQYFTFTNRRKGPMFFKREDGKEDMFSGRQTKDDITDRERMLLMNTLDFRKGWLVQEFDDEEEVTEESIFNKNTFSDDRLKAFVDNNLDNQKVIKQFIEEMTSEFAINRLKEILVNNDAPNSLVTYCDYQLSKLEEEYIKSQKAPIDKAEKKLEK